MMSDLSGDVLIFNSSMSELVMNRALKPWLHSDFVFKLTKFGRKYFKTLSILHNFTKKVIRERREMLEMTGGKRQRISEEDMLLGGYGEIFIKGVFFLRMEFIIYE